MHFNKKNYLLVNNAKTYIFLCSSKFSVEQLLIILYTGHFKKFDIILQTLAVPV